MEGAKVMVEVGGGEEATPRRGCIRSTRGPWTVRRRGRGGVWTTSLRHPTPRERENNRLRERTRRQVATRIYAGLRAHGGYALPKHADQNDVLRALCDEAGYLVDDDGNVTRKRSGVGPSGGGDHRQLSSFAAGAPEAAQLAPEEPSLELTLSFKYM